MHRLRRPRPGRRTGARRPTHLVRRGRPPRPHRPGPSLARRAQPRRHPRAPASAANTPASGPASPTPFAYFDPLVFVENVAALRRRGLDVVHVDLAAIGYDTRWLCLRASDIGAAHRRDRLSLLATPTQHAPASSDAAHPVRP
ncbi:DNA cytosine methyltransferase [Micromonospora sp. URMC 103]|uniref:DNA cytosine methyltransferase n=1 Tax=Micromonospora sp. URMC 103 TaxID=3423406 RepID=UPI003F1A7707